MSKTGCFPVGPFQLNNKSSGLAGAATTRQPWTVTTGAITWVSGAAAPGTKLPQSLL